MNKYKTWNTITDRAVAANLILQVPPTYEQLKEDLFIIDFLESSVNKVLDFGSGFGRNTFMLARTCDSVWAYDFPNMIQLLKEDSRFSNISNIMVSSDWNIVKQEKFDAIVCCISLQHIDKPELISYLSDFMIMTDNLYVHTRSFIDFSGELIYPLLTDKWRLKRIYGNITEDVIKTCKGDENHLHYFVHFKSKKIELDEVIKL